MFVVDMPTRDKYDVNRVYVDKEEHVGSTLEGIEIVTDAPLDRWNHEHPPNRYSRAKEEGKKIM